MHFTTVPVFRWEQKSLEMSLGIYTFWDGNDGEITTSLRMCSFFRDLIRTLVLLHEVFRDTLLLMAVRDSQQEANTSTTIVTSFHSWCFDKSLEVLGDRVAPLTAPCAIVLYNSWKCAPWQPYAWPVKTPLKDGNRVPAPTCMCISRKKKRCV